MPSSIGLFFQTMYNVVDSFYAGEISTAALAALGLSFPVFLLIIATSGGLSRGASALIANAIGAQEEDKQRRYIAQSISLGLVVSMVMTVTGIVVAKPLFQLLGGTGECLSMAMAYMIPIFIGSVFFIITSLSNAILIASGDSKTLSKVLVVGFFLNLVLDPWFLYGGYGLPAMGITGIALATVVIQIGSSFYMVSTVVRRGLLDLNTWHVLLPDLKTYREIAQQALPASFNIMSVALGFFVTTYFLKSFGDQAVAAFGVTTRIEQIGLLSTMGLYAAIMALVGQNNGAGNFDRVRHTMRVANRIGLTLSLLTSGTIYFFAQRLMRVFTDDPSVIEIGVECLHIIMLVQWSYVMTSTHLAMLQATKRPRYGFFESVLRKVLLPLPFFWVIVWSWQFEIAAVWWIISGTNVFMTVITVVYAQWVLRHLGKTKLVV
ncbi:MAG: MATE family efflux transporter [Mariniblastus sp.]